MTPKKRTKRSDFRIVVRRILDAADIRLLVFVPMALGFGGFVAWAFIASAIRNGGSATPSEGIFSAGVALLISSLSGFAEIYRREMPGPLGGTVRGITAVISGILLVLLFGLTGLYLIVASHR